MPWGRKRGKDSVRKKGSNCFFSFWGLKNVPPSFLCLNSGALGGLGRLFAVDQTFSSSNQAHCKKERKVTRNGNQESIPLEKLSMLKLFFERAWTGLNGLERAWPSLRFPKWRKIWKRREKEDITFFAGRVTFNTLLKMTVDRFFLFLWITVKKFYWKPFLFLHFSFTFPPLFLHFSLTFPSLFLAAMSKRGNFSFFFPSFSFLFPFFSLPFPFLFSNFHFFHDREKKTLLGPNEQEARKDKNPKKSKSEQSEIEKLKEQLAEKDRAIEMQLAEKDRAIEIRLAEKDRAIEKERKEKDLAREEIERLKKGEDEPETESNLDRWKGEILKIQKYLTPQGKEWLAPQKDRFFYFFLFPLSSL